MNLSAFTTPVTFSVDELWLLQSVIRHEAPQQETWHDAPASLDLNEQVAEGLVACEDTKVMEWTLLLTNHDLLVIDYCVPASAKTPGGNPLGRPILMKSYRARRALRGQDLPTAGQQDDRILSDEDRVRLDQWNTESLRRPRRRQKE